VRGAPELLDFSIDDPSGLVEIMTALTAAQHGWITLTPGIDPDDAPMPKSVLASLFSGTGPPVPVCTWVAPESGQKPPHAELGVLHQAGPKAVRYLEEHGAGLPDRWVVLADHPRRGLVIALPPDTAHADALDWLMRAATVLTRVPLTGAWQAAVYGRST
jgi:hypothetical protein